MMSHHKPPIGGWQMAEALMHTFGRGFQINKVNYVEFTWPCNKDMMNVRKRNKVKPKR